MKRWSILLLNALLVSGAFGVDELPTHEGEEGLEIEPPLLIQSRKADGTFVVAGVTPDVDVAQAEADLARAQRRAAGAEHLYRAGIIAKVEAEERVLKVVRLQAKLAEARLQTAKREAEARSPNESDLAEMVAAAERAIEQRRHAELEAALRNLQRQQKLLALGSGRKADVNRAEQKLAELQHPSN